MKRYATLLSIVSVGAGSALALTTPAQAATSLNLTPGISVSVSFPDPRSQFHYTVGASATRLARVFDPELKKYVVDEVPTGSAGVTVRATLPNVMYIFAVQPLNGFVCARSTNVITCTGSIPSAGVVNAVLIKAGGPQPLGTRYPVTSTVDPLNTIPEADETDNVRTCNASDSIRHC